jgi:type III pantothenate kinase
MLLTMDIGNTNLTLGLYEGAEQLATGARSCMEDESRLQFLGLLEHTDCNRDQLPGVMRVSRAWLAQAKINSG